jgi:hypothetical protein
MAKPAAPTPEQLQTSTKKSAVMRKDETLYIRKFQL